VISRGGDPGVRTAGRRGETYLALAAVTLFLLVRLALLVAREPFFDELFTVWMAHKPLAQILPALRLDSGPPAYYFLARIPDVIALRVLSLLFATATLLLILTRRSLGPGRFFAAALLAVYPPAVLFAVDARAYAMCGLFVALGAVAVHEKRPFLAAGAFLLAAYTHWYGALFLPLVLLAGRPRRRAAGAFIAACILFVPGLWLAVRQPAEATEWLAAQNPLAAAGTFLFTGQYAEALFASAPLLVSLISGLALVAAVSRSWTFAPYVLVPLLLAVAVALGGRTVYFPMRFESLIAVPLVLWTGTSLQEWTPRVRAILLGVLLVCGGAGTAIGILDHAQRPVDPYREAATVLQRNARPADTVVATGFLYLETVHALGPGRVRAWPAEQATHPGWRIMRPVTDPLPPGAFLWIGERAAPELATLRRPRQATILFANDRAVILRVR